ncbi:MAG: hypothetical protein UZ19_OD1001010 [Parcubacteria bacterium OLB19]|nr:MAG: hypothetical protein UZ19_OD1001010 [Parcubacteria bacterium OLB19]
MEGSLGAYFGNIHTVPFENTLLTPDSRYLVHRSINGGICANLNYCTHGGYPLASEAGLLIKNGKPVKSLVCDMHHWVFAPDGKNLASLNCHSGHCKDLQRVSVAEWNGLFLGFNPNDLSKSSLCEFASSFNIDYQTFDLTNYLHIHTLPDDEVKYPLILFLINFRDLLHVGVIHPKTFAEVADCSKPEWEISDPNKEIAHCIQLVRRKNNLKPLNQCDENKHGWLSLLHFLDENLPADFEYPIDKDIFALWADVCGVNGLMLEIYCGGLFQVISHVYNKDPLNKLTGNANQVEFFIHKSIPDSMRERLSYLLQTAYWQSANEDSGFCERFYENHTRFSGQSIDKKFASTTHETGEEPYHNWVRKFMRRV